MVQYMNLLGFPCCLKVDNSCEIPGKLNGVKLEAITFFIIVKVLYEFLLVGKNSINIGLS